MKMMKATQPSVYTESNVGLNIFLYDLTVYRVIC